MWLLLRTAWRNLFRQRRRTTLAASAMAVSLAMAIPTYGLITGLRDELLKGITGMELGHLQVHNPSYPGGRALQSTLGDPEAHLLALRGSTGVLAAAARAHGYGLAATERKVPIALEGLGANDSRRGAAAVRFGRALDPRAPWRSDRSRPCEAITTRVAAEQFGIGVGTVLEPEGAGPDRGCERLRIVGILRASKAASGGGPRLARLALLLPEEDRAQVMKGTTGEGLALIRSASPVSITGVEPAEERRITFLADRVVEGRYLGPRAKGEILIGSRLAASQRLKIGDALFLQAATLDMSTGSFYQTFRIVGIFRTGVAGVDRSRVFVHLDDAQRMMALGRSVHELVVRAKDPERLGSLKQALGKVLARTPLRVTTAPEGKRAGSLPLPAPVVVYEPLQGGARLFVPDALGPTLGRVPGVAAQGRRVYARARVGVGRRVKAHVTPLAPQALVARLGRPPETAPCGVYIPEREAAALGIQAGAALHREVGEEEPCGTLRVMGLLPLQAPATAGRDAAQAATHKEAERPPSLTLVPAPAPRSQELGDEGVASLSAGPQTLLLGGPGTSLRLVGVEYGLEKALSRLHARVRRGAYPEGSAPGSGAWPVLIVEAAAARLGGLRPGATLLIEVRDEEGHVRQQALRVTGLLTPGSPGGPELVLPYFEAQQVDAPRLNARGHEIALGPAPGITPDALARAARSQLRPLLRSWDEIAPQMKEVAAMQDTFMGVLLFIVFAIAGTTVMNTMLMAVFERTREFGVLKSLGMRPAQVFGLIVVETLLLAVLATAVGGAVGTALAHHLSVTGIDMSGVSDGFTAQGTFINPVWKAVLSQREVLFPMLLLSLVCLIVSLYPAFRAGRLKPVEALRHRG